MWILGPGNTPSYYLAHFIILKKLLIWLHQALVASHGIFVVVPRLSSRGVGSGPHRSVVAVQGLIFPFGMCGIPD